MRPRWVRGAPGKRPRRARSKGELTKSTPSAKLELYAKMHAGARYNLTVIRLRLA